MVSNFYSSQASNHCLALKSLSVLIYTILPGNTAYSLSDQQQDLREQQEAALGGGRFRPGVRKWFFTDTALEQAPQ